MPRTNEPTRLRIITAAHGMFWRSGYIRASLDDIAENAGVTKRTLYQHFRSKDELMAAVLLQASELSIERLRRYFERSYDSPVALLTSLFDEMAQWAAKPRWGGAGFTRVAIELADLPGHPARAIARRHKQTVEAQFADMFKAAAFSSPGEIAREIMLVWEGALTLTLIHGDRKYMLAAAKAAKHLIETVPRTSSKPRGSGSDRCASG